MLSKDENDNGKAPEAILKPPDSQFDKQLSQIRHEVMRHKSATAPALTKSRGINRTVCKTGKSDTCFGNH